MRRGGLALCLVLAAAALIAGCATPYLQRGSGRAAGLAVTAASLSDAGLQRLVADMDPAMLALARRHDPGQRRLDLWGRPVGWASLDISTPPSLGLAVLSEEDARRINALKPADPAAIRPMPAFLLPAAGIERERALQCLAEAVYYEAGFEALDGRRAVAQTVLNRLRHPGYPKSVCGVVYEGAARLSGCQFSFTCDGSLSRPKAVALWEQARDVAAQALAGYVYPAVGTATHYHADYVLPYWAPTLLKLRQVGVHIFYRWTGPSGEPRAFRGRYRGGETRLDPAVLNAIDERTGGGAVSTPAEAVAPQRMAGVEGLVNVIAVPDPKAPGGQRLQLSGAVGGRRIPTPDEVARINALLANLPETKAPAVAPPPTTPAPQ